MKMCRSTGLGRELQEKITQVYIINMHYLISMSKPCFHGSTDTHHCAHISTSDYAASCSATFVDL